MYHIEVAEKFGKDHSFKPEMGITGGRSYNRSEARRKCELMQKYSNSLIYRVEKDK